MDHLECTLDQPMGKPAKCMQIIALKQMCICMHFGRVCPTQMVISTGNTGKHNADMPSEACAQAVLMHYLTYHMTDLVHMTAQTRDAPLN